MGKKSIHQNRLARFPQKIRRLADDLEREIRKHPRVSEGIKTSSPNGAKRAARDFNSLLLARDVTIKRYQQLPDRNICGILDSKLEWHPAPTVGLPLLWTEKHDIRTFVQAYDDPDIRPLVQKMISKAKKRAFNLP